MERERIYYEEPESKVEEKQEKRANVKESLEGTGTAGKAR